MERVSILLFFSCSLVAAIQAGDLQTCARNYKRVGCFADKSDQSSSMLIYDRYGIQWKNIKAYMHSLACRCEKKAREAKKYAGFAIHFWGECYGKTQAQIDAVNGKTESPECTGDQKYDGCAADDKECAGHAYTDFVYKLTPKAEDQIVKKICNESGYTLNCKGGSTIEITNLSYGPRTSSTCGTPYTTGWNSKCSSIDLQVVVILKARCKGKSTCSIADLKEVESDPCPSTVKYVEVQYKCKK